MPPRLLPNRQRKLVVNQEADGRVFTYAQVLLTDFRISEFQLADYIQYVAEKADRCLFEDSGVLMPDREWRIEEEPFPNAWGLSFNG